MDEKTIYHGFIFYPNYYETIKPLPPEERLKLLDAIIEKGLYDREPEPGTLSDIAKGFYDLIAANITVNKRRRENGFKGAGFGKYGGRPRKENSAPESGQSGSVPLREPDSDKSLQKPLETKEKNPLVNGESMNYDLYLSPPTPSRGNERETAEENNLPEDPDFELVWDAYPKKLHKDSARKIWNEIKPSKAMVQIILNAIEVQKKNDSRFIQNQRWVPLLKTWLEREEWDNEYPDTPMENANTGSFDTDSFFEAALQRSYGDDLFST